MTDLFSSSVPRFAYPWMLVLLLLVPWSLWVGSGIGFLSSGRKRATLVLRSLILSCLVAALAGAELMKETDRLAVFFLLDHSNSVPEGLRQAGAQYVRTAFRGFRTSKDEAGVIVFGEHPSVERSIGPSLDLRDIRSFVNGEQTNLAAAMKLARAAFPQGYMRRIVIVSDGAETEGSASEEAQMAQASGIGIDVVPLVTGAAQEVLIREVSAPSRVNSAEPFQLRVVAYAEQECVGTLKIFQRLRTGKRMFAPRQVTLHKGDNVFLLTQELHAPGFYEYEAAIESSADTITANNEGQAFVVVRGEPRVLFVPADPARDVHVLQALSAEGLQVDTRPPAELPVSLTDMQNYDVVVLSNVSATDLTADQLKNLELMVKDLGIGLVMIGGPRSYGAGGFLDTPVEKVLPVSMDIKQRKILPRGALALIMHTCEIPEGNVWAREIGLASLNVLASQDLMGAVGYMYSSGTQGTGERWIYPLKAVGDKTEMRELLTKASTEIGDMPAVGPTLTIAYDALRKADAAVKRIVLISDGDPAAPDQALLDAIRTARISVSTVCIAPHSPNDQNMLQWVAEQTGGAYYFVNDPRNLPQIFTKEAAVVKRGVLKEEPFIPKMRDASELLQVPSQTPPPELRGYVVTMQKDKAVVPLVSDEDDPVMAHWRYGLGKAVAFTSDATNHWAANWLNWDGFTPFWAQTVRWAMREVTTSDFRIETGIENGRGRIRVDAVDKQGRFVNFLRPRAIVSGPPPEFVHHELELVQTGPGIYEAGFPLNHRGAYLINIAYANQNGSQAMISTGLSLGYSREYERHTANLPLLERLAATTGGKVLKDSDNPFRHDLAPSATITPMWPYLVTIAAVLFVIEVIVRRVVIDFSSACAAVAVFLQRIPVLGRRIRSPEPQPRPLTGWYRAGSIENVGIASELPSASFGVAPEIRTHGLAEEHSVPRMPEPQAAQASDDYTSQLLDAKKRARAKQKRRGQTPGAEEDS